MHLTVLFLALMNSGLGHTAFVGVIVICLFLVGACSAFCSLGLVAIAYLLLLVVWLMLLMLTGLTGCAWLAIVVLWGMRCTFTAFSEAFLARYVKPSNSQKARKELPLGLADNESVEAFSAHFRSINSRITVGSFIDTTTFWLAIFCMASSPKSLRLCQALCPWQLCRMLPKPLLLLKTWRLSSLLLTSRCNQVSMLFSMPLLATSL